MKPVFTLVWLLFSLPLWATETGQLIVETVHGAGLENTATGENPDREVAVYLPPGYEESDTRRYPVLLLLHGIMDTPRVWVHAWYDRDDPYGTVARLMDRGIVEGRLQEMIVVMPSQKTHGAGSWYVNSTATGNWEDFTVRELVRWTDRTFRTLARAESRGIAGHSMGGYGAITLGMKHPDTFSVVYAMNPALLGWAADLSPENPAFGTILERTGWEELQGFYEPAIVCIAQAFSPNRDRPPFYADFPHRWDDGRLVANGAAHAAWEAHMPIHMAEIYQDNLLKLRGLRFDSGYDDEYTHIPITARAFSRKLTELDVPHIFEEYNGDHRNRLWGRTGRLYNEVLPWFSLLLEGQPASVTARQATHANASSTNGSMTSR